MEREIKYLLYDLCVKWGFCIPPEDNDWISQETYWTASDFANAVVEAEGFDQDANTKWVNKIATIFQERFGNIQIEEQTFTDRTRGVKESW